MIEIKKLTLQRGLKVLLDKADAVINPGQRVGLIGKNGTGKSSLFALIKGEITQDGGEILIPKTWRLASVSQETPDLDISALDYVLQGDAELQAFQTALAQAEAQNDGMKQAEYHAKLEEIDAYTAPARAAKLLNGLGFAQEEHTRPVKSFSGGWRMRLNLAQALICRADLLLLDEPTNHLDAESIAWLERYLHDFPGTVVAVTHDRYFLDNVAGWILELDRGEGIPYQGNYSSWLEQKEKRLAVEEKQESAHRRALKQELEWVRNNPKGRHSKNKARLARFDELSGKEFQKRAETQEIYIPPGERLGDKVIIAEHLAKGYAHKALYEDLSFNLPTGAILGIIGPNGAGKSTLFNILAGKDTPDAGTIEIGDTVQIAFVDQSRDALDGNKTVWEEVSDGLDNIIVGNYTIPSRAYLGRFNFKGADQQKRVGDLSGGERNRLHLAKLLKSGGNVLLLDEPTNDLDVETLRALEEAILAFPGSALIISHDR